MRRISLMQQIALVILLMSACVVHAATEENRTDTAAALEENEEAAEFRQGLISGYPGAYGAGNQFVSGAGGSGYVNMLRNLYRPPSLGLTDKVKHWVKSFMNRRQQYVKPYYNPASLQYSADEFGAAGKPVFLNGNSYKAISVPLRQLQKYYKPYYPEQQASAASNSLLNYGLYAPSAAGLYSAGNGGGAGSNAAFSAAAANNAASQLFAGSENLFSQGEGPTSALFSASGLYGAGGGQGAYQSPSAGNGNIYSLDGSSLYGSSDGSSAYFGASSSSNGSPSDLYASGANPIPAIYNQGKKQSESALYMPDQRNAGAKETSASGSSYGMDSSRNNNNGPQSSYSQFQGSSSGFQPVSFSS